MIRAVYSERQLAEQLSDFWFNHFNIFVYKDPDRWYLIPYERDAIRPHALGKFRDLLEATAKSPAMLFYLDNSSSADPHAFDRLKLHPVRARPGEKLPPLGGRRGLNENYGRELMELAHARRRRRLHAGGRDRRRAGLHGMDHRIAARKSRYFISTNEFTIRMRNACSGKKIKGGGIKDGEQVLDLLVKDKHTAQHISAATGASILCRTIRLRRSSRAWPRRLRNPKGDIRAVMATMIYSPEFWTRAAFRAKVKTPFELVVSTARALGADVDQPMQLAQWVARIGEPLYQCLPPNGYSDKAAAWVSTGALLNRMNFAVASDRQQGARRAGGYQFPGGH